MTLVGRDAECAALEALMAGEGGALVLRGERGVGKTALLDHAAARAGERRLLRAVGVESESALPYAGLHQLVRSLPFSEPPFGVANALLEALVATAPVVCIVDDAHLLDPLSVDALLFVARRLADERVVLILAADEKFDAQGLPQLRLRGLDCEAAGAVLDERIAPDLRSRILDAARGNPLAIVEFANALTPEQRSGDDRSPESLPVTADATVRCRMSWAAEMMERAATLTFDARRFAAAAELAWFAGETAHASALLDEAQRLAVDPALRAEVRDLRGLLDGRTGVAFSLLLARLERRAGTGDRLQGLMAAGNAALATGDATTARARFRGLADELRRLEAAGMLPTALQWLALADVADGRFAAAGATAAEGLRLAESTSRPSAAYVHHAVLAWVAAAGGHEEECHEHARAAFRLAALHGHDLRGELATAALGELELGLGRQENALAQFRLLLDSGSDLVLRLVAPSMVEAAVRADEPSLAADVFAGFESWASTVPQRALVARCRGLLAAGADADDHFTTAIRLHTEAGRTYDRARTELLFGEALRRTRRRRESRTHLSTALNLFAQLEADSWADRARAELRGSGLTAQRNDPSLLDQLTAQELQVARLVGAGATNKEVAAQLFLSPRTIDFHLRNVFSKLGITSRMQLRWFRLDEEPGDFTGATIESAA